MNIEGTRGSKSRWETVDSKQDATETRSMEIKGEQNPNLLDMSQLPLTALTLLQQLLSSLSDKGKATDEPQM
jgi:hypothetical protein